MEYVEEFERDGKKFICVDFSWLETDKNYTERLETTMSYITKYPKKTLHMTVNVEGVIFDSNTKRITAKYMKDIMPYIKGAAVYGVDGITKMMIITAMKMGAPLNLYFTFSKEKAIERLLRLE